MKTLTFTKLYNTIIDFLLIVLFGIALIMTFALEPKDEYFLAFIGVKIGCFILLMLSYYGLKERKVLERLSGL